MNDVAASPQGASVEAKVPRPSRAQRLRRWRTFPAPAAVGAAMLVSMLLFIVVVPMLPGYDPYRQDLAAGLARPFESMAGLAFPLGSDALGRDLLSRLSLASRVSFAIGASAVAISLVTGLGLGLVAGYFRGPVEMVVMGIADLQLAVPRVLLMIAVSAILGPSVTVLTILLGLTSWVSYGRVARSMALTLRHKEFVLSATTQGASAWWNIRRHVLPNVMPQMVIIGTFEFGQVIMLEAALSFLGLGIQPPLPSLGLMISEGQNDLAINPWISILPGISIFLLVAGSQLFSQLFTSERQRALLPAAL